jgi:hypothetical protein
MACENTAAAISPVKRGDTFTLVCTYKQDGIPTNVEQFMIRAQVRDSSDALVQALLVTKADQVTNPGVFTLSAGIIAGWPIDLLRCDIQFSEEETVRSTQTFFIPVEEDVTHD